MSARCSGLFATLIVVICYCSADPVSFIKKCKPSDSTCLKESSQAAIPVYTAGVPELGVEKLDPFLAKKLDASDAGLKLILTDVKVTGLKECRMKKLQRDLVKSKLIAKAQCDLNLSGKYIMDGQLLILPIKGNGPINVKLRKIILNIDANMEEKPGADGKTYWNIKSWTHTFNLKEKADVEFGNLYPDNKVLGEAARDVIRNNGNDIVNTVGAPVVKSILTGLLSNVNKFFNTVPYEDLVDVE